MLRQKTIAVDFIEKSQASVNWEDGFSGLSIPSRSIWRIAHALPAFAIGVVDDGTTVFGIITGNTTQYYKITCVSANKFAQYIDTLYYAKITEVKSYTESAVWTQEYRTLQNIIAIEGDSSRHIIVKYRQTPDYVSYDIYFDKNERPAYSFSNRLSESDTQFSETYSGTIENLEDFQKMLQELGEDIYNDFRFDTLIEICS